MFVNRAALENSLVSSVFPETKAVRAKCIAFETRGLKRILLQGLHTAIVRQPSAAAKLLGVALNVQMMEHNNLQYLGHGYDALVLKSGPEVVKIIHASVGLPETQKRALAEQRQRRFEQLAEHLGTFVLPQNTYVAAHPFATNRTAVQTKQPFRQIFDPHLFNPTTHQLDHKALEVMHDAHPTPYSQLGSYIESSRELHAKTGFIPDTLGAANLVIDTEKQSLLMIDGHPLGSGVPQSDAAAIVLDQLASLEKSLT